MTIDDFEWVEHGFDRFSLRHKTHELTLAGIRNFNGWGVVVTTPGRGATQIAEHVDNLEAAKVIALIHVNQNMDGYPNANDYRKRAPEYRPEAVPAGVFKMARVRR